MNEGHNQVSGEFYLREAEETGNPESQRHDSSQKGVRQCY